MNEEHNIEGEESIFLTGFQGVGYISPEEVVLASLCETQKESQYDYSEVYREGYVQGFIEALAEGLEDQDVDGYAVMCARGYVAGFARGYAEATVEIAKDMLADNISLDFIAEFTDLNVEQLCILKHLDQ